MPSETAILPSIVTSGLSALITIEFARSSSAVIMQSAGLLSNVEMIVMPVPVQPQSGGCVSIVQSMVTVFISWGTIAGMIMLLMSSVVIAPANVMSPMPVSEIDDA